MGTVAFKDMLTTENKNVLIVDAINLGFRWKHTGAKKFQEEYLNTVRSLARSYECSNIIIVNDYGASSYRKEISPEYKGNREELRAKQTEEEAQKFTEFIEELTSTMAYLQHSGYPVLRYKGVEADDIAALIVKHKDNLLIDNIWLISSDKDWDLLVKEGVSRFSYVTRKETTIDEWPYEVSVEGYIALKCLMGDAGDNVKGIKGIGPKRAAQIVNEYGSIYDIYDAIPIPGKYKYLQELNNNADKLLENCQLMDLLTYCETAIGEENVENILSRIRRYING